MTLSVNKNRWDYLGNGTAGPFVYDNKILSSSHLYVYVDSILKTINTHYTVTGIGSPTGGNVTFTGGNEPANGVAVLLLRLVPLTQLSDYVNHDSLNAETLENDLDKQVMMAQQFDELVSRILKVPLTSTLTDIEVPVEANSFLMWNSDGTQIVTMQEWEAGDPLPDHGDHHENAGADEISVTGLSGLLADNQHVLNSEVINLVYPVGSIYVSIVATNPGTLFGVGTWVAFGAGRVLVGLDAGQTEFDVVEETGGAKTVSVAHDHSTPNHTHPAHSHTSGVAAGHIAPVDNQYRTSSEATPSGGAGTSGAMSENDPHNNLQPYIVCYFWKRTA